jgi:hypothetical protein
MAKFWYGYQRAHTITRAWYQGFIQKYKNKRAIVLKEIILNLSKKYLPILLAGIFFR